MVAISSWIFFFGTMELSVSHAQAFASRSSSKRKAKPKKGSGGFGPAPRQKKEKSTPPSYIPDTSQSTKDFVSFLLEQECEGVGVEGGTEIGFKSSGMRGLFAADNFEAGEFLLGIPFPSCLTLSIGDIAISEPTDAELGLTLLRLQEEGSASEFWPYYQCFPTQEENFDASPDFWTDEQLQALEFPPIFEKAKERQQCVKEFARLDNVDEKKLQFATWLVKSRGFTLLKPVLKQPPDSDAMETDKEPEATIMSKTVMIPYVDFINHDADKANAELIVLETKAEDESFYAVQATKSIRKGQEITLCYGTGQETTADLLGGYGFIPRDMNRNDASYLKEKDLVWSTTLEEDESALQALEDDDSDVKKKTLDFRIRMKRASKE